MIILVILGFRYILNFFILFLVLKKFKNYYKLFDWSCFDKFIVILFLELFWYFFLWIVLNKCEKFRGCDFCLILIFGWGFFILVVNKCEKFRGGDFCLILIFGWGLFILDCIKFIKLFIFLLVERFLLDFLNK